MYAPDTILKLRKPKDPDAETGEPFPYNEVRVIGPSPIDHGQKADAKYTGTDAAGVLIEGLTNFGAVLDEPYGRLGKLYEVVSVPEKIMDMTPKVRIRESNVGDMGPTPEQVFAAEAPGVAPEEGQPRGRTAITSPLDEQDDTKAPSESSPLDDAEDDASRFPVTDGQRQVVG